MDIIIDDNLISSNEDTLVDSQQLLDVTTNSLENGVEYCALGDKYLLEKKYDLMKLNYKKAIQSKNVDAMFKLGKYYQEVEINYELLYKYYTFAIRHNNIDAMFNLAKFKHFVSDRSTSKYNAEKYYKMAIEKGCVDSMINLGILILNEERHREECEKYFIMAGEKGHTQALYYLALYYETEFDYFLSDNTTKTKQHMKIKNAYHRACKTGNIDATFKYGYYYQYIDIDYVKMKKYYKIAIKNKHDEAALHLGLYYDSIEKKYDLAKKCYLFAIAHCNIDALYHLGRIFQLEGNHTQMIKYYEDVISFEIREDSKTKKFIEHPQSLAMFQLGSYYCEIKQYDLMKKYYTMLIKNDRYNALTAAYNLGLYYETIEIDYTLMKKYYEKAIDCVSWRGTLMDHESYIRHKNKVDDDYHRTYLRLGNYYQYIEKDYKKMEENYKTLIGFYEDYRKYKTDVNTIKPVSDIILDGIVNYSNYFVTIKKTDSGIINSYFNLTFKDLPFKFNQHQIFKSVSLEGIFQYALYNEKMNDQYNAIRYLFKASKLGHSKAIIHLKNILTTLVSDENCDMTHIEEMGYYYQYLDFDRDYDLMKKYHLIAIEKGSLNSIINLACYYKDVEYNRELTIEYLKMGAEKNNEYCIYQLGCYCFEINNEYNTLIHFFFKLFGKEHCYYKHDAIEYLLRIIDEGPSSYIDDEGLIINYYSDMMCQIGIMYHRLNQFDNSEKYFLRSIERGNINAMHNLGRMNQGLKKYKLMNKYYNMVLEYDESKHEYNIYDDQDIAHIKYKTCILLGDQNKTNKDLMIKYYDTAINLINEYKLDTDDLHIYSTIGKHYEDRKEFEPMKKYYLLGSEKNDPISIKKLSNYFDKYNINNDIATNHRKKFSSISE